jgi:dTDP-4-dehydrorhamnose 3,5-epimerase
MNEFQDIGGGMEVVSMDLPEVLLIRPRLFHDQRGHFLEIYQHQRYAASGVSREFVQDNVSFSSQGVLRGLHYQLGQPQDKLIVVLSGRIFDVAVDIRRGSPRFGRWTTAILSSEDYAQLFIPKGFAHGFYVLSETATVLYKCSDYYSPALERGIRWDCPGLAIEWPEGTPIVSEKDLALPALDGVPPGDLPAFDPSTP